MIRPPDAAWTRLTCATTRPSTTMLCRLWISLPPVPAGVRRSNSPADGDDGLVGVAFEYAGAVRVVGELGVPDLALAVPQLSTVGSPEVLYCTVRFGPLVCWPARS